MSEGTWLAMIYILKNGTLFFFPGNAVFDTKENARRMASMHDSDFSKHWSWRSVLNLEPSSYHVPSFLASNDNFPSLLDFTLGFNSSFLCLHFNIPLLNSVMMFNEIVKKKKKKEERFLIIYILTFYFYFDKRSTLYFTRFSRCYNG